MGLGAQDDQGAKGEAAGDAHQPVQTETEDSMLAQLPAWAAGRIRALERANQELRARLAAAELLARHDDISGLPNHRAAVAVLARTIARHERSRRPFAVLFVDGDNLKAYNERGYEAGNRMIARLAATLAARLRPTDYVARWLSGDEFVAILPGADEAVAGMVAERLRAAVEAEFAAEPIPVTISVGLALYPADGATPDALMERAIASNMVAKKSGKNRVVTASLAS